MKKDDSIRLSDKYGVNPSVEICSVCGEDMSVVMFGEMRDADGNEVVVRRQHIRGCFLQKLKTQISVAVEVQ